MANFDDLLTPSRDILESNPFSDPFAKRSESPDPWASPFTQSDDVYAGFGAPPLSHTESDDTEHESTSEHTTDPLESSALSNSAGEEDDDEKESLGRRLSSGPALSPGFRESIHTTFSEIATIRPTQSEESESESPILEPPPSEPPNLRSIHASNPSPSPPPAQPLLSHTKTLSHPHTDNSPLDKPFIPTYPSLALGGESAGGWQAEQEPWSNDQHTSRLPAEDDSDDDKPIGQIVQKNSMANAAPPKRSRVDDQFVISVDDPQKVGDPIRSFTMYTVHTRTTSPLYQKSAFSVLRRYSDFLWLYEALSLNNPGVVVPPVPEKNPFGRFDDHFVRQRRFALQKCIQKIANHPVLSQDPDLKLFLESDTFSLDIKHRKVEIGSGGIMASIGSLTGPKFYETDEWFDRQRSYLDSLESQLRGLVKAVELVVKQRTELAAATGEFAQTVEELSSSDIGKQLSQSLSSLAEVERKAQDIESTQSEQDMVTFMGTVDEYARLINSVRHAFNSRIRTYHTWKNAEGELVRVKQTYERNKAQGKIMNDRVSYSMNQISEAERRALDSKHEFEHVSKLVKTEMARFEQERIEDFKNSLHAFLEGMITRQKELISAWEKYQQTLLTRVGGGAGNNA